MFERAHLHFNIPAESAVLEAKPLNGLTPNQAQGAHVSEVTAPAKGDQPATEAVAEALDELEMFARPEQTAAVACYQISAPVHGSLPRDQIIGCEAIASIGGAE